MELPLSALEAILQIRRSLDELEREAIDSAIEKGATRQMIADTLGVTRQAIHLRLRRQRLKMSGEPVGGTGGADAAPAIAAAPPV
jgi:DNA-directed RNA polymerase specialized sigma24 family protein